MSNYILKPFVWLWNKLPYVKRRKAKLEALAEIARKRDEEFKAWEVERRQRNQLRREALARQARTVQERSQQSWVRNHPPGPEKTPVRRSDEPQTYSQDVLPDDIATEVIVSLAKIAMDAYRSTEEPKFTGGGGTADGGGASGDWSTGSDSLTDSNDWNSD